MADQQFDYLVSGIIVNDPNGPRRYATWIAASSPLSAEAEARDRVWAMTVEGKHGVLWVANVLQLTPDGDGTLGIQQTDTYAVYADDPYRQEGVMPLLGYDRHGTPIVGYTPPKGSEGHDRPLSYGG